MSPFLIGSIPLHGFWFQSRSCRGIKWLDKLNEHNEMCPECIRKWQFSQVCKDPDSETLQRCRFPHKFSYSFHGCFMPNMSHMTHGCTRDSGPVSEQPVSKSFVCGEVCPALFPHPCWSHQSQRCWTAAGHTRARTVPRPISLRASVPALQTAPFGCCVAVHVCRVELPCQRVSWTCPRAWQGRQPLGQKGSRAWGRGHPKQQNACQTQNKH